MNMKIKLATLKNVIREAAESPVAPSGGGLELTEVHDEQDVRMLELCTADDYTYTSDSGAFFDGLHCAELMMQAGVKHAFYTVVDNDMISVYFGDDLNEIFKKNGWEQDPDYGDWTHPDEGNT